MYVLSNISLVYTCFTDTFNGKMANSVPCCSLRTVKKQSLKTRAILLKKHSSEGRFFSCNSDDRGKAFPSNTFSHFE